MNSTYDAEDDILYLRFNDKPIAREVAHGWNVTVAYAADGDIVEMTLLEARASGLYPPVIEERQAA